MNRNLIVILIVFAVVFAIALIIGLSVGLTNDDDNDDNSGTSIRQGVYRNGAVATDAADCSKIGVDVLKEGGHAVDAAIAGLICTGVVNLHSTGIGGGGFMNIYDKSQKKSIILDYREVGPASLTPDAYDVDSTKKSVGGLAVGVPGELRGLKKAHDMYGKLPWKRLIKPSIDIARKGTIIGKHMSRNIRVSSTSRRIREDAGLREVLCKDSNDTSCPDLKGTGDYIVNPKYADTLDKVAQNYDVINNGSLSQSFIDDVNNKGGNMTLEDLRSYQVLQKEPLRIRLDDLKLNIYTTPLPGGGSVLTHIINMIKGYKFSASSEDTNEKKILTYHRLAEIFKFSYAQRPYLGDPDKVDTANKTEFQERVNKYLNFTEAQKERLRINDTSTQEPGFYDKYFVTTEDDGTTHVSVIDKDGNAVSATDTINYAFGAKFRSMSSGIIYNNELADYFNKNSYSSFFSGTNITKIPPYNQPGPGRRPLSSTCPSIITDDDGNVVMVVGASGGTRITLSTAWVIMKKLMMNYNLSAAVTDARVQHTFSPAYIRNEKGMKLDDAIKTGLEAKNHEIKSSSLNAIVQAIYVDHSDGGAIHAKSDPRKEGVAYGY